MSTSRSYFVTLRADLGNFYRKTGLSEEHCIFKKQVVLRCGKDNCTIRTLDIQVRGVFVCRNACRP